MDTATLKALGIPEIDIAQVIAAEKYLKCDLNGARIGKRAVRAQLGERAYWNAMHRAAFHWTASATGDDGNEYGFDCRDYFRETER